MADYQTHLATAPEDGQAWERLGRVYDALGDPAQASAAYQQATQSAPAD